MAWFYFLKYFIYLFLERGKGGRKKEREISMCMRNIDWLGLACAQTMDQTCNPAKCPDGESNQRPFAAE